MTRTLPIIQIIALCFCVALLVCAGRAWGDEGWHRVGTYHLDRLKPGESVGVELSANQVTAYTASDGALFETRDGLKRYEREIGLVRLLQTYFPRPYHASVCRQLAPEFILDNWPEIKAIMEGEK